MFKKFIVNIMKTKKFAKIIKCLTNSRFSRHLIPAYKKIYKINEDEIIDNNFQSLNDFFTRAIDMNTRPMGSSKYISPCDGLIVEAGNLRANQTFTIKGQTVDIKTLLGKEVDASSFLVIYLSPSNYHRFHAIADGEFINSYKLGDTSIPVNELGFKIGNPFLKNYRVICESHGYFYIAIGATNVNSIVFNKSTFKKGDEIGRFEFGSTIVLLFKDANLNFKKGPIKVLENLTN